MDAFAPDEAAYAVTAEDQRGPGLHIGAPSCARVRKRR
jgi:hypothetical protein